MPKRRPTESQTDLPFSQRNRERALDHCGNCQARFVAYYRTEESADTETLDVEKCALCAGDPFRKGSFKDALLRPVALITARNVKRK